MGAGASANAKADLAVEAKKPLDASDVGNLDDAKVELRRLRRELRHLNDQVGSKASAS